MDELRSYIREIDWIRKEFGINPNRQVGIAQDETTNTFSNAYAYIGTGTNTVVIGPNILNNEYDAYRKQYLSDVRQHFHPTGTQPEHIVTHELGHWVSLTVLPHDPGDYNGETTCKNIVMDAAKSLGYRFKSTAQNPLVRQRGEISRYAKTNMLETVAEAVADWRANGDKAHEFSRAIVQELKNRLK